MSEKTQYTIILIVILACFVWVVIKLRRIRKSKSSPCCGCSLSDACKNKAIKPNTDKSANPRGGNCGA